MAAHLGVVDRFDTRFGECAVGADRNLPTRKTHGVDAISLERDGQQPRRHLLARRGDEIEFARIGLRGRRRMGRIQRDAIGAESGGAGLGECQQTIGLARHRAWYDHHLKARPVPLGHSAGDIANALDGTHRGSAIFMHDQFVHDSKKIQMPERRLRLRLAGSRGSPAGQALIVRLR